MLRPFQFLEYFVIIIYISLGIYILVDTQAFHLKETPRAVLGTVLVLYGLYRVYRAINKYRQKNEDR
jgi:hypothetical protein